MSVLAELKCLQCCILKKSLGLCLREHKNAIKFAKYVSHAGALHNPANGFVAPSPNILFGIL